MLKTRGFAGARVFAGTRILCVTDLCPAVETAEKSVYDLSVQHACMLMQSNQSSTEDGYYGIDEETCYRNEGCDARGDGNPRLLHFRD